MPLDDPRLICPGCGRLVEVDVDRFEDMFETPEDAAHAGPVFHHECRGRRPFGPSAHVSFYDEKHGIGPLSAEEDR